MKLEMPSQSILIEGTPDRVWELVTNGRQSGEWRLAKFATDWQPGSKIAIMATIGAKLYRDKGVVLGADRPWMLQYSYWSRVSGLPDLPENHSTITLRLKAENSQTLLTVAQDVPPSPPRRADGWEMGEDSGLKHWQFYWRTALPILKQIAERES